MPKFTPYPNEDPAKAKKRIKDNAGTKADALRRVLKKRKKK